MKALVRLLLVLALLPGLMTGLLPVPGQAAGFDMVICGATGVETIRVDAGGNPLSDGPLSECGSCCAACETSHAVLPDRSDCRSLTLTQNFADWPVTAGPRLPVRRSLLPAPRGPPSEEEVI